MFHLLLYLRSHLSSVSSVVLFQVALMFCFICCLVSGRCGVLFPLLSCFRAWWCSISLVMFQGTVVLYFPCHVSGHGGVLSPLSCFRARWCSISLVAMFQGTVVFYFPCCHVSGPGGVLSPLSCFRAGGVLFPLLPCFRARWCSISRPLRSFTPYAPWPMERSGVSDDPGCQHVNRGVADSHININHSCVE